MFSFSRKPAPRWPSTLAARNLLNWLLPFLACGKGLLGRSFVFGVSQLGVSSEKFGEIREIVKRNRSKRCLIFCGMSVGKVFWGNLFINFFVASVVINS